MAKYPPMFRDWKEREDFIWAAIKTQRIGELSSVVPTFEGFDAEIPIVRVNEADLPDEWSRDGLAKQFVSNHGLKTWNTGRALVAVVVDGDGWIEIALATSTCRTCDRGQIMNSDGAPYRCDYCRGAGWRNHALARLQEMYGKRANGDVELAVVRFETSEIKDMS